MMTIADTKAWRTLLSLSDKIDDLDLRLLFEAEPARANRYRLKVGELSIDASRHRINDEVRNALAELADIAGVQEFIQRMIEGQAVNGTEDRAAMHMACRDAARASPSVADVILACDEDLKTFVEGVRSGRILARDGERFNAVVAIGVGGSELGPALVIDAFHDPSKPSMDVRVCSNIDGTAFSRAFTDFTPERTLVVIISKSYTTLETSLNAADARRWMESVLGDDWARHFVAVTSNVAEAKKTGIETDRIFPIWDWVGGRYSIWSAVGLPAAISLGWDAFCEFRAGARDMDAHVLTAPIIENAPLMMALLTVWNANFLGARVEARVPYDSRLSQLPAYLQQLEMESNGKTVGHDGNSTLAMQPAVIGGVGSNMQHAFFQQLHQGADPIPLDILVPGIGAQGTHDELIAGALAQADALAFGSENKDEPHRHFPGNRPSTIILYPNLTPRVLGQLIALYEHKTIATAAIWGINPFDQWGVELGKSLSNDVLSMLRGDDKASSSLAPILEEIKAMRARTS